MELGLFLLPISIIHYLPNFFFGSLLMLFGVEILMDWLIHSFKKVSLIPLIHSCSHTGLYHRSRGPAYPEWINLSLPCPEALPNEWTLGSLYSADRRYCPP